MSEKLVNRLDLAIGEIRKRRKIGIMAHLVAGYPTPQDSRQLALSFAQKGADILEIQIPFSDPTADGPVITEACQKALQAGTKPRFALDLAKEVAEKSGKPVLVMSYFNLLYRWSGGVEGFLKEAAEAQVCGGIVPDIPPEEEQENYFSLCLSARVHPILVLSPNVPEKRLHKLKPYASGMIYATARVGTTGAASCVSDPQLVQFLNLLHRIFEVPIAVGFGIRSKNQLETLSDIAEIAVIGTYFIEALKRGGVKEACKALSQLLF